jgi:hypothetical protein
VAVIGIGEQQNFMKRLQRFTRRQQKVTTRVAYLVTLLVLATSAFGASLASSTRSIIPSDVQQIICVDYRTLKSSNTALALKDRVLPENLKQFETALKAFGVTPERDIEQLAFVSFRNNNALRTVGIAQGQFPTPLAIAKRFATRKIKPTRYRLNDLWQASGGMQMTFLDPTTMLFGDVTAVKLALDTRDGELASLNSNSQIADMMTGLERGTVWSVLDAGGTQNMMRSALGDASRLADYDVVKKRLLGSRYTMDFNSGVNFDLDVFTSDNFTASSLSALVKAGMMFRKMNASGVEKVAIESMNVDSDSDKLRVHFKTDDSRFESLLHSDLFAAVSK